MKTNSFQTHLLTGFCLIALVAPAWAAQAEITARLQPPHIGLGESAQLAVTIRGSQAAEPIVPRVDGLEIAPVGQQSSIQIINGAVSANVTHLFEVTPNRAGSFTIPAITAKGAGATQPIIFRVDQGAAGQAQRSASPRGSLLPALSLARNADAPAEAKGQSAFLRVILPKQELTVGELVPVEVKAYFRAGVSASLNGLPLLSSDAFALNKLGDQPEQTRESLNGVPYTVLRWTTALSAVKAGDYPLNLDLPVMLRVQEHAQRRGGRNPFRDSFGDDSPFGDSFPDDSFFDNFFGGQTEKPLTLHTDGVTVKIKPLPMQGRTAGFSGAVGQFDATADASATTGATGDPLTLKIKITGRGNFDGVATNGLPASAGWKSYKPSSHFEPADGSNTSGVKTFEQSIIPMKAGAQEIPALHFSYFDPDSQSYVTKATQPIAVEITQSSDPSITAAPLAAVPQAPERTKPVDGLAADEAEPNHATPSLRPLVFQPWFIAVNAIMATALFLTALSRQIRARRANDPRVRQREAAEQSVNASLAAMDAAMKQQDAASFFTAARRALQEGLAAEWHVPVSRVTLPEIRSRLNGHAAGVRAVFQTADEIAYSGRRFSAPDLEQWRELVKAQLHQLVHL